jgi:hypothetical protein
MQDRSTIYSDTGYFVFSFDLELAWGYFDSDVSHWRKFSTDGSRERNSIFQLLEIFNEFNISATWGLVGHLFFEHCEKCEICPIMDRKYFYDSYQEIYDNNHPLWYGSDLIDMLINKGVNQELAYHGFTHKIFDEKEMNEVEARIEIEEWLRVANRTHMIPQSVLFPRNKVGYLELFKKYGFICYRGELKQPRTFSTPVIGRVIRRLYNSISPLLSPQVYQIYQAEPSGLVNIPSTQYFFGTYRRFEKLLDSLNLHLLSSQRIIQAVKKAASQKKILHVRAHPCEFQNKKDFEKLRYLLSYIAEEIENGRIQSVGMSQLARKINSQNMKF